MPRKTTTTAAADPGPAPGPVGVLRSLASVFDFRRGLARAAGLTFGGRRDLDRVLGYKDVLTFADYKRRYDRGGIAGRLVDALPKATWRGGAEIVEDEDSSVITPFEDAWYTLDDRLKIWAMLLRTDIVAGLQQFSLLLIGAPGRLEDELPQAPGVGEAAGLVYLTPISQANVTIDPRDLETDTANPRFGWPITYRVTGLGGDATGRGRPVHWTRLLHVADGVLDDPIYGTPRLQRVWNLLDCLDKVTGGGAEAFWKRADKGMQLDLRPEIELSPESKIDLENQVEQWEHDLARVLRTRGVTVNELGSDVADFNSPADAVLTQLAGTSEIPKRILIGSEMGELASSQDRSNFRDQVQDRRTGFAAPLVVRPFIDRLIRYGYLPPPVQYDIRWPTIQFLNEQERANVGLTWAQVNAAYLPTGETVVTPDEIRDHLLGLPPLTQLELPNGQTILTRAAKATTWRALGRRPGRHASVTRLEDWSTRAIPSITVTRRTTEAAADTSTPPIQITVPRGRRPDRIVEYDNAGRITRIRDAAPDAPAA